MTTIVVTEVAELRGRDVPVEALVFNEDNLVIYSRLLVKPEDVGYLLDSGFAIADLHLTAVMN